MTPLRATLALLLVAVVVLVAGCAGLENVFFGPQKEAPLVTQSLEHGPLKSTSQENRSSEYWISIEPIGDRHVGDVFHVNATTNLSAGEEILVQVHPSVIFPSGYTGNGMQQTVRVHGMNNTKNRFEFNLDTTGYRPDEYSVFGSTVNLEAQDSVHFILYPDDVMVKNRTDNQNLIDMQIWGLPCLRINNSMPPVAPSGEIDLESCVIFSHKKDIVCGGMMQFSDDGIVRVYDKEGIQIGAYYDFTILHGLGIPSGCFVYEDGKVKTVYCLWDRAFTVIHDNGN